MVAPVAQPRARPRRRATTKKSAQAAAIISDGARCAASAKVGLSGSCGILREQLVGDVARHHGDDVAEREDAVLLAVAVRVEPRRAALEAHVEARVVDEVLGGVVDDVRVGPRRLARREQHERAEEEDEDARRRHRARFMSGSPRRLRISARIALPRRIENVGNETVVPPKTSWVVPGTLATCVHACPRNARAVAEREAVVVDDLGQVAAREDAARAERCRQ